MNLINTLKPEKVFSFFHDISQIPHGSGNTEQIAQYCLDFAAQRNLKAVKDIGGNIIIYTEGTAGYEHSEPIMIQGHMDMVCEKTETCTKNMAAEGLDLHTDGVYLWAEGTTLGGDDGIALAYIFALLDAKDIPHPPIEAVITRDEETGMFGAEAFDASLVRSRKILNIDSEEEGILTVSCAGGVTAHCEIPLSPPAGKCPYAYHISVSGLTSGHSGVDIGKGRQNAYKVLGSVLHALDTDFCLGAVNGGGKMNVIPQHASAIIGTETDVLPQIEESLRVFSEAFLKQFPADPHAVFSVQAVDADAAFYDKQTTEKLLAFLKKAPTGVQRMSEEIPDLVHDSLNMGILSLSGETIAADFLIRSNGSKQAVMDMIAAFAEEFGGKTEFHGDYPAWEYRKDSPLRTLMTETFCDLYGRAPVISAIHAGLECGLFAQKIPGADIISFGPDIENIHTPSERLHIASAARTWEYLKEILKRSK